MKALRNTFSNSFVWFLAILFRISSHQSRFGSSTCFPSSSARTYVHMYVCTSLSIPVYVTSVTWLAHLSRELPSSYSIASLPDDTTILNLFSLREWGLLQLLLAFIYLAVVMSNTRHKSSSAGPPSRFGRPFSSFLPPISRLSGWRKSFASLFFFFFATLPGANSPQRQECETSVECRRQHKSSFVRRK